MTTSGLRPDIVEHYIFPMFRGTEVSNEFESIVLLDAPRNDGYFAFHLNIPSERRAMCQWVRDTFPDYRYIFDGVTAEADVFFRIIFKHLSDATYFKLRWYWMYKR